MTHPEAAPESRPDASAEADISLLDLLHPLADNLRLLLGGTLMAGLVALSISSVVKPTFTAKTAFLPPQQAAVGSLPALKSRVVLDALVTRFDLQKRYGQPTRQDAANVLDQRARAKLGKDGLITVDVEDEDPQLAAALANAHVEEMGNLLGQLGAAEARQRRQHFESLLVSTQNDLDAARRALGAGALKSATAAAVEGLARLQATAAAQEIKLVSMRSYLPESSVEFRQAESYMTVMRAQLAQSDSAAPASAIDGDAGYTSRYREFNCQQALLDLLSRQRDVARLDESRQGVVVQVLYAAVPPEAATSPKKSQVAALASLAAAFSILLFIYLRQALRGVATDAISAQKLLRLRSAWRRSLGLEQETP